MYCSKNELQKKDIFCNFRVNLLCYYEFKYDNPYGLFGGVLTGGGMKAAGWKFFLASDITNALKTFSCLHFCQRIIAEIRKRGIRQGMAPVCAGALCPATLNLSSEEMSEVCPEATNREE